MEQQQQEDSPPQKPFWFAFLSKKSVIVRLTIIEGMWGIAWILVGFLLIREPDSVFLIVSFFVLTFGICVVICFFAIVFGAAFLQGARQAGAPVPLEAPDKQVAQRQQSDPPSPEESCPLSGSSEQSGEQFMVQYPDT